MSVITLHRRVGQLYTRLRERKGRSRAMRAAARHSAESDLSQQQAYRDPTARPGRSREV